MKYKELIVDCFLYDIIKVYKKYGLSISHEDGHGCFIIEPYDNRNINWLKDADILIGEKYNYEI